MLSLNRFRREIIYYASRLMLDCIQMLFSQTYISVTFLMMYATMWFLNIRFDTHFFAIASCLLPYMRTTIVEFFSYAVRDLFNCISAQRRIQVCSCHLFLHLARKNMCNRHFFSLENQKETTDYCVVRIWSSNPSTKIPK